MRGFMILCLSTVTLAAPPGYNYNLSGATGFSANPVGVAQQGLGFSGSSVFGGVQHGSGFHSNPSNDNNGGSLLHPGGFINQNGFLNNQGVSGTAMIHAQQGQQHHHRPTQEVLVSKRFFIHSAPEDNEEEYKEKHVTVGVPKKNYNVVFIKAPSGSSRKASIKIRPAVNEEKTVIYVLSKKNDASDIHAEVVDQPNTTSKPEVFFIKYKTNEEAAHAQEQIQAQYDVLGGSSQLTDEGVAPLSSVIGSLGVNGGSFHGDTGNTLQGGNAGSFESSATLGGTGQQGQGVVNVGSHSSSAYLPPTLH